MISIEMQSNRDVKCNGSSKASSDKSLSFDEFFGYRCGWENSIFLGRTCSLLRGFSWALGNVVTREKKS